MKFTICALVLACASTIAHAETAEDRCRNLSEYAASVAELRDEGTRLKDVLEVVEERAARRMVDAYNRTAKLVYQNSDLTPAEVRAGMLEGCMSTVKAEKARRAGAVKTSF